MRFEYNGQTFEISFKREFRKVPNRTQRRIGFSCVIPPTVDSRFPYTTATLTAVVPDPDHSHRYRPVNGEVYRTATVGCWHKEKQFSAETGRLRALHLITRTIPRDMRPLMWAAYTNRKQKVSRL